jgi:hypothetical protein
MTTTSPPIRTPQQRAAINRDAAAAGAERERNIQELGFHGDAFLLRLVDEAMALAEVLIETGANLGNTAIYAARRWPRTPVHSCEPGPEAFAIAHARAASLPNADIRMRPSPEFIDDLLIEQPSLPDRTVFCFLDAHGYGFHWPLWDEIALISRRWARAFVLVDDCRVEGRPDFTFDARDGLECSLETITPHMAPGRDYTVLQPSYTERTSSFHPLVGTALLWWGVEFTPSAETAERFTRRAIRR